MLPSNRSSSSSPRPSASPQSATDSRQTHLCEEENQISVVVSPTSTSTIVASIADDTKFLKTGTSNTLVYREQSANKGETADLKDAAGALSHTSPSCDRHHRSVVTASTGEKDDREAECCRQTTASTETFSSLDTKKRSRSPINPTGSAPIGEVVKEEQRHSPKNGHTNKEESEDFNDENCGNGKKRNRLSPTVGSPTPNRLGDSDDTENISNLASMSHRSPRNQMGSNQNHHRHSHHNSKISVLGVAGSPNEPLRGSFNEVRLGSSCDSQSRNMGVRDLVNGITRGHVPYVSGTEVEGFAFCTNEVSSLQTEPSTTTPQHVKTQKCSDKTWSHQPDHQQHLQPKQRHDKDRRLSLPTQRQDKDFNSIEAQSTTWLHDSQDFYSPRLESTSVGVGVEVIPSDPYMNNESSKSSWQSTSCEDATKASINAVKDSLERWRSSLQLDQASKQKREWQIVHIQLGVPSASTNPEHHGKKDSMLNVDIGRVLLHVLAMPVSLQPKQENGHQLLLQALQDARPTPTIEVSLGGMYTTHPHKTKHNSRSNVSSSSTTIAVVACITIEEVVDSAEMPNEVEQSHYTPRFLDQPQRHYPQRPVSQDVFINGKSEASRKASESLSSSLPRSLYPDSTSDVRMDNSSFASSGDTETSYPQVSDDVLQLFAFLVAQSQLNQTNQDSSPSIQSFREYQQSNQDTVEQQIPLQDFLNLITQKQNKPSKSDRQNVLLSSDRTDKESSTRQRYENEINLNGISFPRPSGLSSENVAIANSENSASLTSDSTHRLISPANQSHQAHNLKKASHGFSPATVDVSDRSKEPRIAYNRTTDNKLCPLTHLASISSEIHDQQRQDEEQNEMSNAASRKTKFMDSQELADEEGSQSDERPRRSSTGSLVDNEASENSDALHDDESMQSPDASANSNVVNNQKTQLGKITKLNRVKPMPHPYSDFSNESPDDESARYTIENGGQKPASAFPMKLHETLDIIEADGYSDIIGWLPHGRSFKIHKQKEFSEIILPRYFVMTKKSSFLRQLNLYGFNRISTGTRQKKSKNTVADQNSYYHERFLRGLPHLCLKMRRLKVNGNGIRSAGNPDAEPEFALYPKCPPDEKRDQAVNVATAILGSSGVQDSRLHVNHFTKIKKSPTLGSSSLLQSREVYLPQLRHESNATEISDDQSNYGESTKHRQLVLGAPSGQLASHSVAADSFASSIVAPSTIGTKAIMESGDARLTSHNLFLLAAQLFHHSNNSSRLQVECEPTGSPGSNEMPQVKSSSFNNSMTAASFGTDSRIIANSSPASTLNAASAETSQPIEVRTGSMQTQAEGIVVSSTSTSFPWKLQRILDKLEADATTDVISWLPHGRAFRVHSVDRFVNELMPQYFNQTKYSSFQRQLHMYNFQRITSKNNRDKGAYHHPNFLRGQPDKALKMQRTRVNGKGTRQPGNPETEPDFYRQVPVAAIKVGSKIDIPLFNDDSAE